MEQINNIFSTIDWDIVIIISVLAAAGAFVVWVVYKLLKWMNKPTTHRSPTTTRTYEVINRHHREGDIVCDSLTEDKPYYRLTESGWELVDMEKLNRARIQHSIVNLNS